MPATPVRILLVEDTPQDVQHFVRVVGSRAIVSVALTGAEALDRLFRRGKFSSDPQPDLVVMDLNVPLLSGHEVLNVIRANSETKHLPVIVYSVSDDPRDIVKAYSLGASAYLVKPMDINATEAQLTSLADFWLTNVSYGVFSASRGA